MRAAEGGEEVVQSVVVGYVDRSEVEVGLVGRRCWTCLLSRRTGCAAECAADYGHCHRCSAWECRGIGTLLVAGLGGATLSTMAIAGVTPSRMVVVLLPQGELGSVVP